MIDWHSINAEIFALALNEESVKSVPGGDICQSFYAQDVKGREIFIKAHPNDHLLKAEYNNLRELTRASIRTPKPIGCYRTGSVSVLVMEYLPLIDVGDEYQLGQALADMHAILAEDNSYGLNSDNFIGHNPQKNCQNECWAEFWWDQRLSPQLSMAQKAGFTSETVSRLKECTFDLLSDHYPSASLLHGDLWGGNKAYLATGEPVLFDPATYYGDRETDLAFTHVFGGFGVEFYRGYNAGWTLSSSATKRQPLYNLYHMLNHYNLFGRGYESAVNRLFKDLGVSGR